MTAPLAAFVGYLLGTAVGAAIFYGRHTRDRALNRGETYQVRELKLVWTWAALLAIPGFIGYEAGFALVKGISAMSLARVATRALLVVLGVSLPVSGFVVLIPGDDHEEARGVLAGGFLVWVSLQSLLIAGPSNLPVWLGSLLSKP